MIMIITNKLNNDLKGIKAIGVSLINKKVREVNLLK